MAWFALESLSLFLLLLLIQRNPHHLPPHTHTLSKVMHSNKQDEPLPSKESCP